MSTEQPLFDVEQFRGRRRRLALVREVHQPTLVLGSTQKQRLVDDRLRRARRTRLLRRRGGGGVVYLGPGTQLWLDTWIPRQDPLWLDDLTAAAAWVAAWWMDALSDLGQGGLEAHTGPWAPGEHGRLVCFAGRGPGEVFHAGRKLVGLSQWRAREGALFSSCAYVRWDPLPLVELLELDVHERSGLVNHLRSAAVGLAELTPALADPHRVRDRLLQTFPGFSPPARPTDHTTP